MHARTRPLRLVSALAFGCVALAAAAQGDADYRNLTAGGPLRPGVYGRIEVRRHAPPPPVIYPEPVRADGSLERVHRRPVYLYVPPGQVRKWSSNCAKWRACDLPVLFVRMDHSPSRWGAWRVHREQLAGAPHAESH